MIASMTGFGKGEASDAQNRAVVEVRAVNSRYCDVAPRIPQFLSGIEPRLKETVQATISRGRIEMTVSFEGPGASAGVPVLNLEVARGYWEGLSRLREALGVDGTPDLRTVAVLPDVFRYASEGVDLETAWALIEQAAVAALEQCNRMRRAEGDLLRRDFESRIGALECAVVDERGGPGPPGRRGSHPVRPDGHHRGVRPVSQPQRAVSSLAGTG
jgi:uncharacterized protein (TIGR00255 family)